MACALAKSFAALAHPGAKVTKYPAFKTATVHLPDGLLVDFATARDTKPMCEGVLSQLLNHQVLRRIFLAEILRLMPWPCAYH